MLTNTSAMEEPMNRPEKELEMDKLQDDIENGKLYEEEIKESDANLKPGADN